MIIVLSFRSSLLIWDSIMCKLFCPHGLCGPEVRVRIMACKRSLRWVSQFRRRLRVDGRSTFTSHLIHLSLAHVAPKATTPFIRLCGDYRPIVALYLYLIRHVPYIRTVQSSAFRGIKLKEHSDNNLNN